MKTIELKADKTNYILLIIIFLVFAVLGVMISIKFHLIAGLTTTLTFVLITAYLAWMWKFESEPQLIINDDGIHDLRSKAGFIPWKHIENGSIKYVRAKFVEVPSLCLLLYDPEPYIQRFSRFRRPFLKFNSSTGFADIQINLVGLKGAKPEEIDAAIRERIAVRNEE